jgi:hypothetical protein
MTLAGLLAVHVRVARRGVKPLSYTCGEKRVRTEIGEGDWAGGIDAHLGGFTVKRRARGAQVQRQLMPQMLGASPAVHASMSCGAKGSVLHTISEHLANIV